jgi:hypothetical protein
VYKTADLDGDLCILSHRHTMLACTADCENGRFDAMTDPKIPNMELEEHVDRLKLAAKGDLSWDLSPNDITAIRAVLFELDAERARTRVAERERDQRASDAEAYRASVQWERDRAAAAEEREAVAQLESVRLELDATPGENLPQRARTLYDRMIVAEGARERIGGEIAADARADAFAEVVAYIRSGKLIDSWTHRPVSATNDIDNWYADQIAELAAKKEEE